MKSIQFLECPSYCKECVNETVCTHCDSDNILVSDICLCKDEKWLNFETGACELEKKEGYYPDAWGQYIYRRCPTEFCAECDPNWFLECRRCVAGYYLQEKKCLRTCSPGFYQDEVAKICTSCSQNCLKCTENQCLKCERDYLRDSEGKCVPGFFC